MCSAKPPTRSRHLLEVARAARARGEQLADVRAQVGVEPHRPDAAPDARRAARSASTATRCRSRKRTKAWGKSIGERGSLRAGVRVLPHFGGRFHRAGRRESSAREHGSRTPVRAEPSVVERARRASAPGVDVPVARREVGDVDVAEDAEREPLALDERRGSGGGTPRACARSASARAAASASRAAPRTTASRPSRRESASPSRPSGERVERVERVAVRDEDAPEPGTSRTSRSSPASGIVVPARRAEPPRARERGDRRGRRPGGRPGAPRAEEEVVEHVAVQDHRLAAGASARARKARASRAVRRAGSPARGASRSRRARSPASARRARTRS